MLCCFFNVKENSGDSKADLITDAGYTVEVKGKDARMGSGSDNYAFNVWKSCKFVDLITDGGGEGVKRVATQQQYNKKVNIKSPQSFTSKILTNISKIVPGNDGLYSNHEETNTSITNTLADVASTIENIGSHTFDDTFTASLTEYLNILNSLDWNNLNQNQKRKPEDMTVRGGAGSKTALNEVIGNLQTLIPLLGQIHSYEIASKLTHTASFYGQQIQAWVNWITDEAKKIGANDPAGAYTINDLTNLFIDGMLEARNWSFDSSSDKIKALRTQIAPLCTELLTGCTGESCSLDTADKSDITSKSIKCLVAAIHVWCYHQAKEFDSILFISENQFSPESVESAKFPCIGLDFPVGGKPVTEIYNFFMDKNFTIQLDIDEARKDGIKVNFDG
jgi:hypothetical protein